MTTAAARRPASSEAATAIANTSLTADQVLAERTTAYNEVLARAANTDGLRTTTMRSGVKAHGRDRRASAPPRQRSRTQPDLLPRRDASPLSLVACLARR